MELHLPSLAFLITFFISLMVVIKKGYRSKAQSPISHLPPGPSKLPLIGSLHHLWGSLPHHKLCDLAQKHGPIMLLRLGQVDLVVISSRDAAEEILKTHDLNFAYRPDVAVPEIVGYGCTGISFAPYGSYWRQLRKICVAELLSIMRVKSFSSLREEEISNLVKDLSLTTATPINLSSKLIMLTNNIISRAAFGKKCRNQQRFMSVMKDLMRLGSGFSISDLFPSLAFIDVMSGLRFRLEKIHQQMDEILSEIIKEHETKAIMKGGSQEEEEDLVDVLLRLKEHGELEIPITISNLKAVILDVFGGGTETSSMIIEWAMAELMRNPKAMEKAQWEVRQVVRGRTKVVESHVSKLYFLKLVIKETLRLHSPVPLLVPRVCKETCQVQGYTIPAGSRVVVNAWALGRDPVYWDTPLSFWPERFTGSTIDFKGANFEFIPFGAGRRMCPGMAFGLVSVELALAQLLFCFDWKLPTGMKPEDLDMTENFGATAPRKSELVVVATPYVPVLLG